MLSFLFYGLGEFIGALMGAFYLLRGDLRQKNSSRPSIVLKNEPAQLSGES